MTLLQLVLVAAICVGLFQVLIASRHYRFLLLLVGAFAILLVICPSVATDVANWLNVGRGADLVIYLSIVLLGMLWVRSFLRSRSDQRQITLLVRSVAITGARVPDPDRDALPKDNSA